MDGSLPCFEVLDPTSFTDRLSLPSVTQLLSASPKPATGQASLRFEISTSGEMSFEVLDMQGRAIWRDSRAAVEVEIHQMPWNAKGGRGQSVSSGVFLEDAKLDGSRAVADDSGATVSPRMMRSSGPSLAL